MRTVYSRRSAVRAECQEEPWPGVAVNGGVSVLIDSNVFIAAAAHPHEATPMGQKLQNCYGSARRWASVC